jgi:hypothetical protein
MPALEGLASAKVAQVVRSRVMRKEISIVAGPREWGDTRESWLSRVPKAVRKVLGTQKETVTFRTVRSLWYGSISDPEHHAARDIRRAAEIIKARGDALALAKKYESVIGGMNAADADFYREDIARLERVARLLCGVDRTD